MKWKVWEVSPSRIGDDFVLRAPCGETRSNLHNGPLWKKFDTPEAAAECVAADARYPTACIIVACLD